MHTHGCINKDWHSNTTTHIWRPDDDDSVFSIPAPPSACHLILKGGRITMVPWENGVNIDNGSPPPLTATPTAASIAATPAASSVLQQQQPMLEDDEDDGIGVVVRPSLIQFEEMPINSGPSHYYQQQQHLKRRRNWHDENDGANVYIMFFVVTMMAASMYLVRQRRQRRRREGLGFGSMTYNFVVPNRDEHEGEQQADNDNDAIISLPLLQVIVRSLSSTTTSGGGGEEADNNRLIRSSLGEASYGTI